MATHLLEVRLPAGVHSQLGIQGCSACSEDRDWYLAQLFIEKGPSASLEFLRPEPRALMYAFRSQGLNGPFKDSDAGTGGLVDEELRQKRETWRGLGNMPKTEARRRFVELLSSVLPEWRRWCLQHADRIDKEQQSGGEAERLLHEFSSKTGWIPARLSRL